MILPRVEASNPKRESTESVFTSGLAGIFLLPGLKLSWQVTIPKVTERRSNEGTAILNSCRIYNLESRKKSINYIHSVLSMEFLKLN
jgi:hypothetical protein